MLTTTLNAIRAHNPCADGWKKLLAHLGKKRPDDEPLPFATILDSNGLADALWCCRAAPEHSKTWRLYAVWCARQVQHLMTDQRSLTALDVAERHAMGLATDAELAAAWDATWDATWAAALEPARTAAWTAAWAAAWAAWAARDAARDATWAAARDAAQDAAWTAARAAAWAAARDAGRDAGDAARAAAWDAARADQIEQFRRIIN